MVFVEHAVSQIFAGAAQAFGDVVHSLVAEAFALEGFGLLAGGFGQNSDDGLDVLAAGGLVDADADAFVADVAEVDAVSLSHFAHLGGRHGALDSQRVEIDAVVLLVAVAFQLHIEARGFGVDVGSDGADAFGTVPSGIETAHNSLQSRSGADVRSSLFAFDVLFAHTQSHTQCGVALDVDTPADDAAGEAALEGLGDGEEAGVRTAEAHRQTEALVAAKGAVGTHLAGGLEQSKSHQIGGHTDKDAKLVGLSDELGVVADFAKLVGILHDSTEESIVELNLAGLADNDFDVARSGVGAHHVERLREDAVVDKNLVDAVLLLGAAAAVVEHNHTFAASGGLVEERRVGQRHTGHIADHRLIGHQGFETALADFGLIGSVGGVPASVFEDIALDDSRCDGVVVTHTDIALEHLVLLSQSAAAVQEFVFVDAVGDGHRLFEADAGRDGLVDKFFHR